MKYEREEKFLMTLSQNKPLGTIDKFFYRTIETKIRFLEVFEKYGIATPDGVRLDELPTILDKHLEGLNAERKNTD
ncbi:hypothetical protein [Clostridium facile]|uniref:Uncharacterized protein n=1 Tax=Clostridium facile TaxID=2763035 RepID=A0ABR7INL8_9CLOT|nr:hypothetical protein [Clostridium facile]MBC5786730.1 hypothetical protein [Clostridium facile]